MLDKDLCVYVPKDTKSSLSYYQDRIAKVIDEIKNSNKKYTIDDFPLKTNVSIINENIDLSNIVIDENYSLLKEKSEIYIYPTKIKNILVKKRQEKENILNKKNNLYEDVICCCLLFVGWILMFITANSILLLGHHTYDIVGYIILLEIFEGVFSILLLALNFTDIVSSEVVRRNEVLLGSFFFLPIKEIILIIFLISTIKAKKEADNYSQEDIELELNKLVKDLPQSVRNIVLAEKVSFY